MKPPSPLQKCDKCGEVVKSQEMAAHQETHKAEPCPLGCGMEVPVQASSKTMAPSSSCMNLAGVFLFPFLQLESFAMEAHMEKNCKRRQIRCEFCRVGVPKIDLDKHQVPPPLPKNASCVFKPNSYILTRHQ